MASEINPAEVTTIVPPAPDSSSGVVGSGTPEPGTTKTDIPPVDPLGVEATADRIAILPLPTGEIAGDKAGETTGETAPKASPGLTETPGTDSPASLAQDAAPDAGPADKPEVDPEADPEADAETDAETDAEAPEEVSKEAPEEVPEPDPFKDIPPELQVRLKPGDGHIDLILPLEKENLHPDVPLDFVDSDIWQQLQQRLGGSDRFWSPRTPIYLRAYNRLLDMRQLQEIAETLERFDLKLDRVYTYRRQTAVAAATAGYSVEQAGPPKLTVPGSPAASPDAEPNFDQAPNAPKATVLAEPLYLKTTLRSGAEIRHPGTVVVMGDLNPGSAIIADGDILVWGRIRGVAHAGASGNQRCVIMALQLQPTQLRIANAVARVPESAAGTPYPEVAYIEGKSIRITGANAFTPPQ